MVQQILFVCTGNTCRSPMAEGLLRLAADQAGIRLNIRSAGVSAVTGCSISNHSLTILQSKGMVGTLSSKPVTGELVEWAELVLTMTSAHKRHVIQLYPQAVDKIYTLKEFVEDNPEALAALEEHQQLLSELEWKRALSHAVTVAEQQRLRLLESKLPQTDISDPYGGSRQVYERCAEEIEGCIQKLLRKLT